MTFQRLEKQIMKLIVALAAAALMSAPSLAAPCKDAKGKFIKCPVTASAAVAKGKDGRCRIASGPKKGQFTKC